MLHVKAFAQAGVKKAATIAVATSALQILSIPHFSHAQDSSKLAQRAAKAIEDATPKILEHLLKAGLDPNSIIDGRPLLSLVIVTELPINGDPFSFGDNDSQRMSRQQLLEILLKAGADLNATDNEGATALVTALSRVPPELTMINRLLEEKPDVAIAAKSGLSAIHLAADQPDVLKRLLELGADPDSTTPDSNETALMFAAAQFGTESIRLLIDAGADPTATDQEGYNACHFAVGYQSKIGYLDHVAATNIIACLTLLKSHGSDPTKGSDDGTTALHLISIQPQTEVIPWLLDNGIEVDTQDKQGRTPLHVAISEGRGKNADMLIKASASADRIGPDGSALTIAARAFHERQMTEHVYLEGSDWSDPSFERRRSVENVGLRMFIEKAQVIDATDSSGRTPLMWAAATNFPKAVTLLLEKGARLDATAKDGRTALIWAACANADATVKLLIAEGADPNARDDSGRTASDWANELNKLRAANPLTEPGGEETKSSEDEIPPLIAAIFNGSDADALAIITGDDFKPDVEYYGASALHFAAEYGRTEIAKALVNAGASIDAFDATLSTPLLWASRNEHWEIVDSLINAGGDPLLSGRDEADDWNLRPSALEIAATTGPAGTVEKLLQGCPRPATPEQAARLFNIAIGFQRTEVYDLLQASPKIKLPAPGTHLGEYVQHPLGTACRVGNLKWIREITQSLGETNIRQSDLLAHALIEAIASKQLKAVEFLVNELGAEVDIKPPSKEPVDPFAPNIVDTPFRTAIWTSSKEVVAFLIRKGVQPNADDLNYAVRRNPENADALEPLISAIDDIDAYDDNETALMEACQNGYLEYAKLLLKHGADPNKLARDKRTVLDYAKSGGNAELIELIKKLTSAPAPP